MITDHRDDDWSRLTIFINLHFDFFNLSFFFLVRTKLPLKLISKSNCNWYFVLNMILSNRLHIIIQSIWFNFFLADSDRYTKFQTYLFLNQNKKPFLVFDNKFFNVSIFTRNVQNEHETLKLEFFKKILGENLWLTAVIYNKITHKFSWRISNKI